MTLPWPTTQLSFRPGILDLGWGQPDPALLPASLLQRAAHSALAQHGADALSYGAPAGPGRLRVWLAEHLGTQDARAPEVGELMLTGGNSIALDQVLTLLTAPGDTVLVESPTYHLAVRILRDHPLRLVPVPADSAGLNVDALAETVARLRQAGQPARALYLVPTFNNPTGASLSPERRAALVRLAEAEGLLVIEDDVYRELAYDGPAPASLWSQAQPGTVVRLGTFSKTLAPGLRLGWLTASRAIVARIADSGVLDSGGGLSHFAAMVVHALCAAGEYAPHVAGLRATYRARRDALAAALRAHLPPGCGVKAPAGGYFVWVELPPDVCRGDAAALLPLAEAAGMSYLPGERFRVEAGGPHPGLRLAFSLYGPAELAEAARRLGEAARLAPEQL